MTVPEAPARGTIVEGLPALYSVREVAEWLDLTIGELEWFADHGGWLRTASPRLRHYHVWTREKRDGVRVIEAPKPRLREAQRQILRQLISRIPAHPAAKGFIPGRSTTDFARPHSGEADGAACGPAALLREHHRRPGHRCVRPGRLPARDRPATGRTVHHRHPARPTPGRTRRTRRVSPGQAPPQGAPTSPHLSNLVMRPLDRRLHGYGAANGLTYTRYGDDLALSGHEMNADRALWVTLRVIADEGFTVHAGKVRIMRDHQRQTLAGLVVNDRPRVSRAQYDALRALLHNARRHGASSQNHAGHPDFRAHVLGLIAWVGASDPARRERLHRMAADVDWTA